MKGRVRSEGTGWDTEGKGREVKGCLKGMKGGSAG